MANDRDIRRMMSQNEREATAEGNQRAKGINAVSNFIERNNDDFQKELGGARNDIRRITEKARRLKVERMAGTEGIREIEKSVSGILNRVGYVFDIMGRGVVKISSITKETLQNYKNILQRELNISAPNTVAMALSRATPIFGYFAAKFMETGVFRKFSDAIKNKLSDAASVVGSKFKSMFRAGQSARENTRIPKLQKGGYVAKTGLAQVHAAEVVVPSQKLFREFNLMFKRSIKPVTTELGAIREQLTTISEPNVEGEPGGIYGMIRDMFKEIPMFKTFIKISDWMAKPLKWLFSTQSKYKAKVPKGPNVLGNIATTLGMIYADFMHKYDHILSSLKAIGMGLDIKQERFREPREKMEATGIQKIRLGARGVKRWWKPAGKKEEGMFDKIKRMLGFGGAPEEGGWESPSQKAAKKKREKVTVGGMGGGFFSDIVQKAWETMLGFAGVGAGEVEAGGVGGLGALRPKNIKRILFGGKHGKVKEDKTYKDYKIPFAAAKAGMGVKEGEKKELETKIIISEISGKAARFISRYFGKLSKDQTKQIIGIAKPTSKIVATIKEDTAKIIDILKKGTKSISDYLLMTVGAIGGWVKSLMTKLNPLRYLKALGGLGLKGLGKAGGALLRMLPMGAAVGAAAFGVYEMIQAFRGEKTLVGELFGMFGEWISGGKYKGPGWLGDLVFDIVESASKTISKSIDSVVGYVKEKAIAIKDLVLYPVDFMWDLAVKAKDWIVDLVKKNPLVKAIGWAVEKVTGGPEKAPETTPGAGQAEYEKYMQMGGVGDPGYGPRKYGQIKEVGDGVGKSASSESHLAITIREAIKEGFADVGKIIQLEYQKESLLGKAAGAIGQAATGATGFAQRVAEKVGITDIGKSIVSGATTIGERLGSLVGIKKMPDVDISGVQEPIWKNFSLMAEEYKKGTGKEIQLNSAYRSPAKQAELYKTNPYAAPPGKSPHGKGLALDINSGDAYGLKKEGLMEKYGFYQPMGNEPWHLQMKPQVGDPKQFNVPYKRKDLIDGEVENAMMGINGMSKAMNPMVGAIDKGLKGVNAAIISNSNVITNMQSNQQGGGGGRQSGQGSFDPEIAAILSGNI